MVLMSDKSFKQLVAEVKVAYNIVDYIQQSGVKLKQRGMKWKGLCPFHNEKSASFTVDENYQNFRCFGCGAAGDLMNFVQRYENLDFFESLKKLAEDKGIEVTVAGGESSIDYKSLRACIKSAANFFYTEFKKLPEDHVAKKSVTERGLSLGKMLYGYAPEGRQTLYKFLREQGFSEETILLTGVCGKSEKGHIYDFWQGRLMFFITDITGKPIGFSGRKLYETDVRGKYVNSIDGPLFDKGASLYHVEKAKKPASDTKVMYVVEGQFDVASFVEAGMHNVVASSGTAFTEKQGLIIRRLVTETGKIIFAFDGDKAGVAAAVKVFKNVPAIHGQSFVATFPDGQDPCDYRQEHGSEALIDYVNNKSVPLIEFILDTTADEYDMDSPLGRSSYVEAGCSVLKSISSAPLREFYIKKVSLDGFTPVEAVREVLADAKPIENLASLTVETKEEESFSRPKFEEYAEVEQSEVIETIKKDGPTNIAARVILLSFMDRRLIPVLLKNHKFIPEILRSILKDFEKLSGESVLVPEQFELDEVVEFLFNSNLFPLAHLMTEEMIVNQFKYLMGILARREENTIKNLVRSKISRIIEASNNEDVGFFERALLKEGSEIQKLVEKAKEAG